MQGTCANQRWGLSLETLSAERRANIGLQVSYG